MKNEINTMFIGNEHAIKLKELGFDEPCFARFRRGGFQLNMLGKPHKYNSDPIVAGDISCPLWQQVFDWFREVHGLNNTIHIDNCYQIVGGVHTQGLENVWHIDSDVCTDYATARKDCLHDLITLVKQRLAWDKYYLK